MSNLETGINQKIEHLLQVVLDLSQSEIEPNELFRYRSMHFTPN